MQGITEIWVCGSYLVHHFNGIELYVVYHRPALCTTDLRYGWCTRGTNKSTDAEYSQSVVHNVHTNQSLWW